MVLDFILTLTTLIVTATVVGFGAYLFVESWKNTMGDD